MLRCHDCYQVIDVRPCNDLLLNNEGIEKGTGIYWAQYRWYGGENLCRKCRRRIMAFIRWVRMYGNDGRRITIEGNPCYPPFEPDEPMFGEDES